MDLICIGGGQALGAQGGPADFARAQETFSCPVFHSRHYLQHKESACDPLLSIDMRHEGITATRWALRGVVATLRPY